MHDLCQLAVGASETQRLTGRSQAAAKRGTTSFSLPCRANYPSSCPSDMLTCCRACKGLHLPPKYGDADTFIIAHRHDHTLHAPNLTHTYIIPQGLKVTIRRNTRSQHEAHEMSRKLDDGFTYVSFTHSHHSR
jgi:hypothetical protein